MSDTTTALNQLQHLLPIQRFQGFVGQHKADRYTKKLTCRNQLSILLYAQATGKNSLRDIETGLLVEHNRCYHLGLQTTARSTLAKANERRPYHIYESLFYKLVEQCRGFSSGTASFSFKNDLKAVDASTIDLCLSLFPWARFRTEKGALKIHTVLDIRGQIPEVIIITDDFRLSAANIAAIYKRRWDIELFFKWIKQHLKIKTFLGTSKNAVMTQIWIAIIYYLLLAWVKAQTKFTGSLLDLTRIIQAVILKPVSLLNLLQLTPKTVSEAIQRASPPQASLF